MKHEMQVDVFEQGHRMILSSLEKLSISPRLDRSASSLSGTTVTSETEPIDGEDLIAPIAPGLIKYPGIPFGGDRSSNPKVPKRVLDRVDEWFVTTDHDLSCLHIHMHDHDDAMHDLCNRILQDIVNSGRWPICYNGLPRDGPPPAPGWYTMTHAIWWLSGQLYIPVPHKDGHMPSRGYDPNVELIIERLEKQVKTTPFIVLYLLERSCPTDSDLRLYELLINRLIEISHTSRIKLLIFSGVSNGVALGHLPGSVRVDNPEQNGEIIALAEWDCKIADNDDDDDKDEEGDNSMVENESSY